MNDMVSIITPSYNTADYIIDTIKSVQNQTYSNWEMIIVDDCSTDETIEVVRNFIVSTGEKRIRLIKLKKNIGAAKVRNFALRKAKGRWIAFLDSDDLWTKEKLEKQIKFMEENNYSFTYTKYIEFCDADENSRKIISGPKRISKRRMYDYCWPGCLTVMYDAQEIGVIQIRDIKKNNDYAIWLRAIEKSECYLLDEELALYRKGRAGSISSHSYVKMIKWHYLLFRRCLGKSVIASFAYTLRNLFWGMYKKLFYTN